VDASQKLAIETLQDQISDQFDQSILNILNGEMMYKEFSTQGLMGRGDYVPFNEAMCSNETHQAIFSDSFNKMRASGHHVSLAEYENITISPLESLFKKHYSCIVLWFGYDMFCQMNLLTVLAYLDQIEYRGKVFYHKVQELTYEVEATELVPEGYKKMYVQVLLHHCLPNVPLMPVMYQGIKFYLEYLKKDNEITAFIKKNRERSQNDLLKQLVRVFPQYGLGDLQYINIINTIKDV
jgi:hypothetical protein